MNACALELKAQKIKGLKISRQEIGKMNIKKTNQKSNHEDLIDIFVGVDGGASKCRVRVEDAQGNLLGLGNAGVASIKLSVEGTWRAITSAVSEALLQSPQKQMEHKQAAKLNCSCTRVAGDNLIALDNPNYRFHLGLGLAGCEIPSAREKFLAQAPVEFATVCLQSDAYTACLGAHGGDDGAIIIVGTGVIGMQICAGKTVQVGGWGFPHGDEGSAAWLGLEAVRQTLQWGDGRLKAHKEDTDLFTIILNEFNNDMAELVVWANAANSSAFAKLAPIVVKQAQAQNIYATELMRRAAREVERVAEALRERLTEIARPAPKQLPYALGGGLAEVIKPWLSAELRERLVACRYNAECGAILMLKKAMQAKQL